MSKKSLLAAALLGGLAALGTALPLAAAEQCLEVKQIQRMHAEGPDYTTMTVRARGREYRVEFTAACKVGDAYPLNHFVYDEWHLGRCLDARDVLPTSKLGACFVKSVTPIDHHQS